MSMTQTDNAFKSIAPTAENHFRLLSHAAVFRLVHSLRRLAASSGKPLDSCLEAFPFLSEHFDRLRSYLPEDLDWTASAAWWEDQVTRWEAKASSRRFLPLRRLADCPALTFSDRLAMLMIGWVEDDIRFGALFAALQEPLPTRRISQGLLEALLETPETRDTPETWGTVARLLRHGLIVAENQEAPRAEWTLRVPLVLWDMLRGEWPATLSRTTRFYRAQEFLPLKQMILDPALQTRFLRLPALLTSGHLSAVTLRGMAESGRRSLLGSLARCLRRDVLYWEPAPGEEADPLAPLLGSLCLMTGAFPVLALDPAPGETCVLPDLVGYDGVVGIILPREGGVSGTATHRALTLSLPSPTLAERARLWRQILADGAQGSDREENNSEALAARFRLPLGTTVQVAKVAGTYAALEQRTEIKLEDVQRASRSLNRQVLDRLAQRLELGEERHASEKHVSEQRWQRLVVNPVISAELHDLETRCRCRETLLLPLAEALRRSVNPGVRALFNGPSGTGKTLAARILAAVLQMDLYRVDLASLVNKYVGETEKNLSRLLARAEELDVILLLDEGDSLMSGRTDVKSANDRYANLETNYLLQRLEGYEGIVFVTTNAGSRIDTAFERRFDAVITFAPPGVLERQRIWEQHLPPTHAVSLAPLTEIASVCALTGGQIRNAALHATLLATAAGRVGQVNDRDLHSAVEREYRKAGAACPISTHSGVVFDPVAKFLTEAQ